MQGLNSCQSKDPEIGFPNSNRGVKRQDGNKSLPYKTYLSKGLTQNNHGFQWSLAQNKKSLPAVGAFSRKFCQNSLLVDKMFGAYRPYYSESLLTNQLRLNACAECDFPFSELNNGPSSRRWALG